MLYPWFLTEPKLTIAATLFFHINIGETMNVKLPKIFFLIYYIEEIPDSSLHLISIKMNCAYSYVMIIRDFLLEKKIIEYVDIIYHNKRCKPLKLTSKGKSIYRGILLIFNELWDEFKSDRIKNNIIKKYEIQNEISGNRIGKEVFDEDIE